MIPDKHQCEEECVAVNSEPERLLSDHPTMFFLTNIAPLDESYVGRRVLRLHPPGRDSSVNFVGATPSSAVIVSV